MRPTSLRSLRRTWWSTVTSPGYRYEGDDPDGFMVRDDIVRYIEDYVKSFDLPLVEGVTATRLRQAEEGGFRISTTRGELTADRVVLATGPYQAPLKPRIAVAVQRP